MLSVRHLAFAAAAALIAASPAHAVLLDDFNRADSADIGTGWTQVEGTLGVVDGKAYGDTNSLGTFNGSAGNNVVEFDISYAAEETSYVAAVIGWGSAFSYFIKVQNNDAAGFGHYGFYTGNNETLEFDSLVAPFTSAHVTASVEGSLATLRIDPNVGDTQIYIFDYGVAFSGGDVGLGFFGAGRADNFAASAVGVGGVPEPASWALMLLGFGALGAALRARPRQAAA